ncbi:MAG: protocatechuate 3,4-dioxygenase [Burkholderiales bacterium]
MENLIYAFGSSHAPQLAMPPETWELRADVDRKRNRHAYRDGTYSYQELVDMRRNAYLIEQNQEASRVANFQRCQVALDTLADKFAAVNPDVLVLIGDDQHEWFEAAVQPSFAVVCAENVLNAKYDPGKYDPQAPTGIEIYARTQRPPEDRLYPVQTDLALRIIEQAIEDEIDVTTCSEIPKGERGPLSITHSVGFIVRRILRDKPIPMVPILQNTFYPPNQAKPGRCFDFGKSIARALQAWGNDNPGKRIAICASGGLSHYVIDEEWDQRMLDAMVRGDESALRREPNVMFRAGTSETKNWITACGALSGSGLTMKMLDYVPCYRSEAGTGTAMAFATWEKA